MPRSSSQPCGSRGVARARLGRGEQVARGVRAAHVRQARRAGRCRGRGRRARRRRGRRRRSSRRAASSSRSCSTTKSELPGALEVVERREQRLAVGRMQAGGRLVEHVDHAEQVGADLRRQAQPLQLARRQRRRAAVEREVAEAERLQRADARDQVVRRCAARRCAFPPTGSGVRRTSGAPACAEPPAATRRAVSSRAAARLDASALSPARRRASLEAALRRRAQAPRPRGQRQLRQRADVDARRRSPTAPRASAACRRTPGRRCRP